MRRAPRIHTLLSLLLLALATAVSAGASGYIPRPCGFDLNDNGILGQPADCQICNGVNTDPDGDGVLEDLIYVDCNSGNDAPNCGSPQNPCGTLDYATQQRVDGPGDGAEDIVCFRGICHPDTIRPHTYGLSGHRVAQPKGNDEQAFQYPTNPAMIVGWDSDGDRSYPPFDPDDTAVIEGSPGVTRAFLMNDTQHNSHFELAHFTVRNFNLSPSSSDGGFLGANHGRTTSHLYVHDIALRNINSNRPTSSGITTFRLFVISGLRYFAVENIDAQRIGGYFARGNAGDGENGGAGPIRFKNISLTARSCNNGDPSCYAGGANGSEFTLFKFWGHFNDFEILDSDFDCNLGEWSPYRCTGIGPAQCSQDVTIRGNTFKDFGSTLIVQATASGFCDGSGARPVDDIVFDKNAVHNDHPWRYAPVHVNITAGDAASSPTRSVTDVTVTNNFFSSSVGHQNCLAYLAGNDSAPQPGTIIYANNTCHGVLNRSGFAAFDLENFKNFKHQNIFFDNNVISGLASGNVNVELGYQPSNWQAHDNAYSTAGVFRRAGTNYSQLSSWRNVTGQDQSSEFCFPDYVDASNGNLHLQPFDNCARDQGTANGYSVGDIDGDSRPLGQPWDRGADEQRDDVFSDDFESGNLGAWTIGG